MTCEFVNRAKVILSPESNKPEILRVHGLKEIEGFDFRKYFTEYSMSNQDWIVKMREAATKIPEKVARSSK